MERPEGMEKQGDMALVKVSVGWWPSLPLPPPYQYASNRERLTT